jgi:hypothetical protein
LRRSRAAGKPSGRNADTVRPTFDRVAGIAASACYSVRMKPFRLVASAIALSVTVCVPLQAQQAEPAPLSELVAEVDIPYETFTLSNGLTTIVHTDRKAPIVGVTIY